MSLVVGLAGLWPNGDTLSTIEDCVIWRHYIGDGDQNVAGFDYYSSYIEG